MEWAIRTQNNFLYEQQVEMWSWQRCGVHTSNTANNVLTQIAIMSAQINVVPPAKSVQQSYTNIVNKSRLICIQTLDGLLSNGRATVLLTCDY